jgi:hypothetical protein
VYDAPENGIVRSSWTVAPGADLAAIRLRYNRAVTLTASNEVRVAFEAGVMAESRPVAWQDVNGLRRPVEVRFVQLEADVLGFRAGPYRSDLPLTIDPTLTWHTFLGGIGNDYVEGRGIAVDGSGNVCVGGRSNATWEIPAFVSGFDAFAAKIDNAGGPCPATPLSGCDPPEPLQSIFLLKNNASDDGRDKLKRCGESLRRRLRRGARTRSRPGHRRLHVA